MKLPKRDKPPCPHKQGIDCGGSEKCRYWCHYIHTDPPRPKVPA